MPSLCPFAFGVLAAEGCSLEILPKVDEFKAEAGEKSTSLVLMRFAAGWFTCSI